MAQDKERDQKEQHANGTTGNASSSRKAAEAEAASDTKKAPTGAARAAPRAAAARGAKQAGFARRRQQYLIAVRPLGPELAGFQTSPLQAPQSIDAIVDYLTRQEGVEIVARMKPAGAQPFAPNGAFAQEVVVARLAEDRAEGLRAVADPRIIVERDGPLVSAGGVAIPRRGRAGVSTVRPLSPVAAELSLRVVDERDQPLPRAAVVVYGSGFPVQATTDDSGTARLSLFGGAAESVDAIYVKPAANYWERFIVAPDLNDSGATTIAVRPLTETFPNFPNDRAVLWDRRLMRLDQVADGLSGAGIRVAIVESGCDNTHPALRHVTRGKDFTVTRRGDNSWTDDALGYGTHSAGLIAAAPGASPGMVGCAPEAEVHILKVLAGGRSSDFLAALDECIARDIDVVALNVGYDDDTELLARKLRELQHKGIACIAAAGSSASRVPAGSPSVLAVGAVGRLRSFPADTCHARTVVPELIGSDGVFPAAFTGVGPHIGVSAPGVAVLSTVPGGYAALDGTSAAASLVTGFATLILAHHPLFRGPLKARSEQRVGALFNLLAASAVPQFADPLRGGVGVPNLQRVPGLYGMAAGMRSTAAATDGVFAEDNYGDGGNYGAAAGIMPFLLAWPSMGPAWAGQQGWSPLMRPMRGMSGLP